MATIQKKVSVKEVCGNITALKVKTHIARFYGMVSKRRYVNTAYGDSIGFQGQIRGVNAQTGETIDASEVFLPDVAAFMLDAAMGDSGNPVQFGFDIYACPSEKGERKYTYACEPLLQESGSPLDAMGASLPPLLLPAPKEDEDTGAPDKSKKK